MSAILCQFGLALDHLGRASEFTSILFGSCFSMFNSEYFNIIKADQCMCMLCIHHSKVNEMLKVKATLTYASVHMKRYGYYKSALPISIALNM